MIHATTEKDRALEKVLDAIEDLSASDAANILEQATEMQKRAAKAYRSELGNCY